MNRGDTFYLLLDYQLNGSPLVEGQYQEIELQINSQFSSKQVKKLLSDGSIEWKTVTYVKNNQEHTFTGYVTYLDQEDTFTLQEGNAQIQLRIMVNDEVGSSAISTIDLGKVLSAKVLSETTDQP